MDIQNAAFGYGLAFLAASLGIGAGSAYLVRRTLRDQGSRRFVLVGMAGLLNSLALGLLAALFVMWGVSENTWR